jgi:hypothetical protein
MKRHISTAVLLCVALMSACGIFDENQVQNIVGPLEVTSRVKFFNFSVGSVGVNFFANGAKVTSISSSACTPTPTVDSLKAKCLAAGQESATGVVYGTCTNGLCSGGTVQGGLYAAIVPGSYTLTAKMATKDTIVASVTQAIDADKFYSFYMSGIYNTTTKTAEAFVIEDPVPTTPPDLTLAHVRFVNAVPNAASTQTLYAFHTTDSLETAVGPAVAYQSANAFITLKPGVYNLRTRVTGAVADLIARTTVSFVGGRVYTVTVRGNAATASTLGLDNTENQRRGQ